MDHLENNTTQLPINACKIDNLYCVQNVLSSIKVEPKNPLTPIPVNIPIPSPPDFTKLEIKGMKEENTNSEVKSNTRLLTPLLVSTASIDRIRVRGKSWCMSSISNLEDTTINQRRVSLCNLNRDISNLEYHGYVYSVIWKSQSLILRVF